MSLTVDETAGDLPVRDVGLRTMLGMQEQDIRSWRKPQVLKIKERQHVFRVPRERLEDQCLRLQEENMLLKQYTRTQEQKLRRLSIRVLKLKQSGTAGARAADTDEAIEVLEARVATLESQKEALQGKLNAARHQILSLCGRTPHRPRTGRGKEREGGARRVAQTAPAYFTHSSLEDTRDTEKFRTSVLEAQNMRVTELEHITKSLRETLKDKEREIEDTTKELHQQQADGHRLTIKDNVDIIRLQKQLSEKNAALLVIQEKFTVLQEAYEAQLEEGQRSLRESQEALLGKVEELSDQLKKEKHRVLTLEGQLSTATLLLQGLEEFQERVSHLEGERNLLKKSYDALLESTLNAQSLQEDHENGRNMNGSLREEKLRAGIQRLEEQLQKEKQEREKLEQEKERLMHESEEVQVERAQEKAMADALRETHNCLEKEVLHHRQEVASLQERLDRVTKEFDLSAEDLSETLIQIKAFRLQRESCERLWFLGADGKVEDSYRELVALQATHAETVLELQKTRDLLQIQHRLNNDLQAELKTVMERTERERDHTAKWAAKTDKLLKSRALQINNLQAQLKDIAYRPGGYKWSIPQQYTWTGMEEENIFSKLREGESLLEIHLIGATFTPTGLRLMAQTDPGDYRQVVTFCTYALLDFEVHSTPLVSGTQPNYGFTSCYALTGHDLTRLGLQGTSVLAELHQALGGVRFITWGRAKICLMGALQRRRERVKGTANITGSEGEIIGALDFWVCLYPQVEPRDGGKDRMMEKRTIPKTLDWSHVQTKTQEVFDFGGGIPNELVVIMERCVGLSTRWPGLLPDTYLTYRLYDLPPHSTPTVPCCADPVFADSTIYPLAATADVMEYLKVGSLWVYVFDDSECQTPPTYLAKTPIPLRALAGGRPIKGDYVLRDPAGGPRGMVRVHLHWRYPFQTPGFNHISSSPTEIVKAERNGQSLNKMTDKTEVSQRPTAKPRLKSSPYKDDKDQPQLSPPPIKIHRPEKSPKLQISTTKSTQLRAPQQGFRLPESKSSKQRSNRVQEIKEHEEEEKEKFHCKTERDSDISESEESGASSGSDMIIFPQPPKPVNKEDRLRVEIFSLSFDPSSSVALDQSVQQVYVEYRLLGVPMETTETPMSLRKPTLGEEIHYNFTRVIHVNTMGATPLRHYLYTMLEGTDPNQGRLKFTVVSEPLNEEDECEDVGYAYLDLQELLLTGNDVIERQIDIISTDDNQDVVGKLRVSLEAAEALTGIYWEYKQEKNRTVTEDTEEEEEQEEERQTDKHK